MDVKPVDHGWDSPIASVSFVRGVLAVALAALEREAVGDEGSAGAVVRASADQLRTIIRRLDEASPESADAGVDPGPPIRPVHRPEPEPAALTEGLLDVVSQHPLAGRWITPAHEAMAPEELFRWFDLVRLRLPSNQGEELRAEAGLEGLEFAVGASLSAESALAGAPSWPSVLSGAAVASGGERVAGVAARATTVRFPTPDSLWRPDPWGATVDQLATAAGMIVALAELDPDLRTVHLGTKIRRLDEGDNASLARRRVMAALDRLFALEPMGPEAFEQFVLLDETVHSYVHDPPAHSQSWVSSIGESVRQCLWRSCEVVKSEGFDIDLRPMPADYREARELTGGTDIGANSGRANAVLSTIRLWSRIEDRAVPGRVIYSIRSPSTPSQ